jgi:hypothetical protein
MSLKGLGHMMNMDVCNIFKYLLDSTNYLLLWKMLSVTLKRIQEAVCDPIKYVIPKPPVKSKF